jgi:hypothetical protein
MKTKDLIALLQTADPTGEEHCCVGNADIWTIDVCAAYYDGALHVIDRDEEGHPTKGRRRRTGSKICISTISIGDAIDYEDFVVEYETDDDRKRYEKFDLERLRKDKEINFEVEKGIFASWVFMKIQSVKPIPLGWVDRIKKAAEDFYKLHRGPDIDGKAIESYPWEGKSYADRLESLWGDTIHVEWDNYSRIIIEYKQPEGTK